MIRYFCDECGLQIRKTEDQWIIACYKEESIKFDSKKLVCKNCKKRLMRKDNDNG